MTGGEDVVLVVLQHPDPGQVPGRRVGGVHRVGEPPLRVEPTRVVVAPGEADELITNEQKTALDALHLRKIDLADRVLVVNPGGYIGESTSREIAYAHATGKPISFTDPV